MAAILSALSLYGDSQKTKIPLKLKLRYTPTKGSLGICLFSTIGRMHSDRPSRSLDSSLAIPTRVHRFEASRRTRIPSPPAEPPILVLWLNQVTRPILWWTTVNPACRLRLWAATLHQLRSTTSSCFSCHHAARTWPCWPPGPSSQAYLSFHSRRPHKALTFRARSSLAPTQIKPQPTPVILGQESVHTTLSITHHSQKWPSTGPRTLRSSSVMLLMSSGMFSVLLMSPWHPFLHSLDRAPCRASFSIFYLGPRSFLSSWVCLGLLGVIFTSFLDLYRASWSSLEVLDELYPKVLYLVPKLCINIKLQIRHARANLLYQGD
jgi:hypothetical protein